MHDYDDDLPESRPASKVVRKRQRDELRRQVQAYLARSLDSDELEMTA